MKITVVQPSYFVGDEPDKKIAEFLINEIENVYAIIKKQLKKGQV